MDLTIGKSRDRDFAVDAQELVTGRTCIIAQSGAGKSWSIAVLCERLCAEGIGFCLIDTEGEYFSLKDKFPVIWVGTDEESDEDIETVNLREFMTLAVRNATPVVYDVSETDMQERVSKLANILYDIASELRIPYLLIVEEADKFIPQSKESIKKIEEISRRGRKRGLGLLVATQRPALVTKNVLSQCNNQIIGKLSIENDLKAVDLFFDSRRELEELAELEPGEFFVMGKISREKTRMRFGKRLTKHRGLTPQLAPRQKPQPKQPEDREKPAMEKPREKLPLPRAEFTPASSEAVALRVSREEALDIAQRKRKRKVLGIGPEESIVSLELVYWPMIDVEVRYIGGVLRKATKTARFSIDGLEGRNVEFNGTLRLRAGFSQLIGFGEQEVHLLSCMTPDGATEADLESKTKLSPADVKKALKTLREQKKVTVKAQLGDAEIYVPLLIDKIPNLGRLKTVPALLQEPVQAQRQDPEIEENDLRTVLKGLEPTAEIVSFTTFAYPVYVVSYATSETQRTLAIDGVGGGIIDT